MPRIYRISTDSDVPHAWCMPLGWCEGKMDYLPTGSEKDDLRLNHGAGSGCAPGLNIWSGRSWPKVLGSGGALPAYYFSEQVIASLDRESIKYRRLTEMPIVKNEPASLVSSTKLFGIVGGIGVSVTPGASGG